MPQPNNQALKPERGIVLDYGVAALCRAGRNTQEGISQAAQVLTDYLTGASTSSAALLQSPSQQSPSLHATTQQPSAKARTGHSFGL